MAISGQIIIPFGDAPTTPSLGKITIYVKSDKNMYFKDDQGVEYPVTISGGVVTNHGQLLGLDIDDHNQYLLRTDFTSYSGTFQNEINDHKNDSSIHFSAVDGGSFI